MKTRVALVFLSLLCSILLLELALGGWLGIRPQGRLRVLRDFEIKRDVSKFFTDRKEIIYRRDKNGLRGSYGEPAAVEILTVGGSTTDQINTTEEETWQEQIVRHFAKEGKQVRVANAGTDGQSTYGHLEAFDQWLSRIPGLRPRYVLFYTGVNDFYKTEADDPASYPGWKKSLAKNSVLFNLFEVFHGWYRVYFKCPLIGHRSVSFENRKWTNKPILPDAMELVGTRVRLYGERIEKLAGAARRIGAEPIFVSQRFAAYRKKGQTVEGLDEVFQYDGHPTNGVDVYHLMSAFNAVQQGTCRKVSGICIDLAEEIQLDTPDFYDYVHTNTQGTEKLSRYLYGKLSALFARQKHAQKKKRGHLSVTPP